MDMSELAVNQCVYVEWYQFKTCTIRTCKNFTDITKSKCLAIDRVQPAGTKVITDAELHMYKFPGAKVSTRLVSMKRKRAVLRVKSVLILRKFIDFLTDKHQETKIRKHSNRYVARAETVFPLKIKQLGFQNWMWPYLVSEQEYKEFTTSCQGECSEFALHDLLHMTDLKFRVLVQSLS